MLGSLRFLETGAPKHQGHPRCASGETENRGHESAVRTADRTAAGEQLTAWALMSP